MLSLDSSQYKMFEARRLPESAPAPVWLKLGFWACTVIAVAVVIRRVVTLAGPSRSGPLEMVQLDAVFADHAALTLAHILPALLFVLLAPFAMFRKTQRFAWIDDLLFSLGAVVGLTAYAMSYYSVGGWTERSAVLLFDTLFLVSLFQAVRFSRLHDEVQSRRWLVRAVVVLLGIATTRPVMGVFFATRNLTHWTLAQFFGLAFWVGFGINTFVAEFWLRSKAKVQRRVLV